MKKIYYITGGHTVINNHGTGAVGLLDEAVEAASMASDLATMMKDLGYEVYNDPPTWSLTRVWSWLAKWIKPNDVLLDIHFNAGPPTATGMEIYIPNKYTNEEFAMANIMAKNLKVATASRLRLRSGKLIIPGVKIESESQHTTLKLLGGLGIGINLLVEICFITNPYDVEVFKQSRFTILRALFYALTGTEISNTMVSNN